MYRCQAAAVALLLGRIGAAALVSQDCNPQISRTAENNSQLGPDLWPRKLRAWSLLSGNSPMRGQDGGW